MKNTTHDISISNIKRWVPFLDKLTMLGLPSIVTAIVIGVSLTPQDWSWPKIALMVAIPLAAWAFGIKQLIFKLRLAPDFVVENGPTVWTNGVPVTAEMVEHASQHFKQEMFERGFASMEQLDEMFKHLTVEFSENTFVFNRNGKKLHANGLQAVGTHGIRVRWLDGFHRNAFFHECMHVLRDVVFGLGSDYSHSDSRFWDVVPEIKKSYKNIA